MSLEVALQKANRIVNIVQYFHKNRKFLNEDGSIVRNETLRYNDECYICYLTFDDMGSTLSEFEYHSGYINFYPDKEHLFRSGVDSIEKRIKYTITYNDSIDSSTEEGYFQRSTLYDDSVLEALVLADLLYKNKIPEFYLDLDKLDELEKIINKG